MSYSIRTATPFTETREYKFGDSAQREWAATCVDLYGGIVLPIYDYTEIAPEDKAPTVMCGGGDLIAPDLLFSAIGRPAVFLEVKAKTEATWRRRPPGPRWEHGIDYSCATEYREIQDLSGIKVFLVLREMPSLWLLISLDLAFEIGDRRTDWPGGKAEPNRRGRRGLGGLLWPRSAMRWLDESTGKWHRSPPELKEK